MLGLVTWATVGCWEFSPLGVREQMASLEAGEQLVSLGVGGQLAPSEVGGAVGTITLGGSAGRPDQRVIGGMVGVR